MSRINILIADSDEQYIDALCKYLMESYSDRLNIIAFTNKLLLQDYIKESLNKTDIQLVSTEMLFEDIEKDNPRMVYLSETRNESKTDDKMYIFKYQCVESIAAQIFEAFSRRSIKEVDIKSGERKCTVISVYSPAGGSGKSTVAVALCKCLNKNGSNSLYLNLESAPSTLEFFTCESANNLSNILYGIKGKSKNMALKIEAAISVDPISGVSFIPPLESPIEMEEIQPEEITMLIEQIRLLGKFDYIVIDMSSSPNAVNIEILKESDTIFTVSNQSSIAQNKLRALYRLFEIVKQRENINLSQKNVLLINKNSLEKNEEQVSQNIAEAIFSLPDSGIADPRKMTDELAGFMDFWVLKYNLGVGNGQE